MLMLETDVEEYHTSMQVSKNARMKTPKHRSTEERDSRLPTDRRSCHGFFSLGRIVRALRLPRLARED